MQLGVVALSSTQVRLEWSPHPWQPAHEKSHYAVHENGVFRLDAYWTSGPLAYELDHLRPQTRYCYRVVALEDYWPLTVVAVGRSNEACVTTPADLPPTAPGGVTAAPESAATILVSWQAATDDYGVTGYRIYRDGSAVAAVSPAALEYLDRDLTPQTTYCYLVSAIDAVGQETRTTTPACTETLADTASPTAPRWLFAVSTSPTEIRLTWPEASDDSHLLGYRVYRDGALLAETAELVQVDAGLVPDTGYRYEVAAYDAGGNESERTREWAVAGWSQRDMAHTPLEIIPLYTYQPPAIGVDAAGKVEIAWCNLVGWEETRSIHHLTSIVPGAQPRDLAADGETLCDGPDLAFDAMLQAHISYYGGNIYSYGRALKHWSGFAETVAYVGYSAAASIAVDSLARVHLTYVDHGLNYWSKVGGAWWSEAVDDVGGCDGLVQAFPRQADLALAPSGAPHIAYQAASNTGGCEIRHAWKSADAWQVEVVDSAPGGVAPPAIGVDPDGVVFIVYGADLASGASELRVATGRAGAWSTEVVDAGPGLKGRSGLAIGPGGEVHLVWHAEPGLLRYATRGPGTWQTLTLQEEGHINGPVIAADPHGAVHIAYLREGGRLFYATNRIE
jgi:chitodextrinase